MTCAGLKKCRPTSRSARPDASPSLGDRQRRGIAGQDRPRRAAPVQLGQHAPLEVQSLPARPRSPGPPRPGPRSRACSGPAPPCPAPRPRVSRPRSTLPPVDARDVRPRQVELPLIHVLEHHRHPRRRDHIADPAAHRARADHALLSIDLSISIISLPACLPPNLPRRQSNLCARIVQPAKIDPPIRVLRIGRRRWPGPASRPQTSPRSPARSPPHPTGPSRLRLQLAPTPARPCSIKRLPRALVAPIAYLWHQALRSRIIAPPIPPPTHAVASPSRASRSSIAFSRVTRNRVPVQPTGCPSAIAPPCTLTRSQSQPSVLQLDAHGQRLRGKRLVQLDQVHLGPVAARPAPAPWAPHRPAPGP